MKDRCTPPWLHAEGALTAGGLGELKVGGGGGGGVERQAWDT